MKTRTSLERGMTIKTGDFSNIKPSVSISVVHDVEDTGLVYSNLAGILDSLLALEILALSEEMEVISHKGWGYYKGILENSLVDIQEELKENVRVLSSILERNNG